MILLALDPGFKRLGFSVFNEEEDILVNGVYTPRERNKDEKYQDYLNMGIFQIEPWFNKIVKDHKVTNIFAETIPPISNGSGFASSPQIPLVISVIAVCKILAHQQNINWEDVSARRVKKLVTEDASASKAKMRRAVLEAYPEIKNGRLLGAIPFDETDAISIGMAFFYEKDKDES